MSPTDWEEEAPGAMDTDDKYFCDHIVWLDKCKRTRLFENMFHFNLCSSKLVGKRDAQQKIEFNKILFPQSTADEWCQTVSTFISTAIVLHVCDTGAGNQVWGISFLVDSRIQAV